MENEQRLIDATEARKRSTHDIITHFLDRCPTVDAVPLEKYNDLREAFVDYVCSGAQNPAPYCRNRCAECIDRRGWCISQSDKCRGFNPDGAKMDGDGNG